MKIEPRMLGEATAAGYCGIGRALFLRECPVAPVRIGARKLWDRRQIDQWLDGLSGSGAFAGAACAALDREVTPDPEEVIKRLYGSPRNGRTPLEIFIEATKNSNTRRRSHRDNSKK